MPARHWPRIALALAATLLASPLPAQTPAPAPTETPEERYVHFYFELRDAEVIEKKGDYLGAEKGYTHALALLKDIARTWPGWKRNVVDFRLRFCQDKLTELEPLAERQKHAHEWQHLRTGAMAALCLMGLSFVAYLLITNLAKAKRQLPPNPDNPRADDQQAQWSP